MSPGERLWPLPAEISHVISLGKPTYRVVHAEVPLNANAPAACRIAFERAREAICQTSADCSSRNMLREFSAFTLNFHREKVSYIPGSRHNPKILG